jgi:glycosyltransferase involved in cell wall biosynthesis
MNDKNPLISVIIPNFNHAKYIEQRLETVFNQTYLNFEVILLDDCSTDNSRDILSQYSQQPKVSHCVFNEKNTGNTFVQWRKGLQLAKGEYIWIAESDDFCELNFLEVVVKPLIENNEVFLSYCQSNKVNQEGIVTGNWIGHTDDLDSNFFCENFCLGMICRKVFILRTSFLMLVPC